MKKKNKSIPKYMLSGFITWLPILFSLYIIYLISSLSGLKLLLIVCFKHYGISEFYFPIVNICIFIVFIISLYFVGRFGRCFPPIKWINKLFEYCLSRLSLLGEAYQALKTFFMFFSSSDINKGRVVLVEYPKEGVYTLGLLTNYTYDKEEEMAIVYMLSTPTIIANNLMLVPKNKVKQTNWKAGQALKYLASGGTIAPPTIVKEDKVEPISKNENKDINKI